MRVLVTGPREWPSRSQVFFQLTRLASQHDLKCGIGYAVSKERLIVVHGNAGGVDHFADEWAGIYGIPERHGAFWHPAGGAFDRLAGFKRNQEMVDSGADWCLAFLMLCTKKTCRKTAPHYTHGTWDCVTRARKAAIPVTECYLDSVSGSSGGQHG